MGNINRKINQGFEDFKSNFKEIVKSKSVYQYQIAHFKILDIEKKIVPTAEEIQIIKIKKILTTKRLADLKKSLLIVKAEGDELNGISKLTKIEKRLEKKLQKIKKKIYELSGEDCKFNSERKKIAKLELRKQNLKQKSQYLDVKIMKNNNSKRLSMQANIKINTIQVSMKNKSYAKFLLNQKLEACDNTLDRLDNLSNQTLSSTLEAFQAKIGKIKFQISALIQEKEKTMYIQNLDLVELNKISHNEHIRESINTIRTRRSILMLENRELYRQFEGRNPSY